MDKKTINDRLKKICAEGALAQSFCRRMEELLAKEERTLKWKVLLVAVERVGRLKKSVTRFVEPMAVGTRDGFIQMAWQSAERSLEFQATDPGWYIIGTTIGPNDRRTYSDIECDPFDNATLLQCYRWFEDGKAAWPESKWLTKKKKAATGDSDEEGSAWIP